MFKKIRKIEQGTIKMCSNARFEQLITEQSKFLWPSVSFWCPPGRACPPSPWTHFNHCDKVSELNEPKKIDNDMQSSVVGDALWKMRAVQFPSLFLLFTRISFPFFLLSFPTRKLVFKDSDSHWLHLFSFRFVFFSKKNSFFPEQTPYLLVTLSHVIARFPRIFVTGGVTKPETKSTKYLVRQFSTPTRSGSTVVVILWVLARKRWRRCINTQDICQIFSFDLFSRRVRLAGK